MKSISLLNPYHKTFSSVLRGLSVILSFMFGSDPNLLQAEETAASSYFWTAISREEAKKGGAEVPYGYWLGQPSVDKKENKPLPLVIFLHGAGERGDDLQKVLKHGPPKFASEGQSLPYTLVAPQCPEDEYWHPEEVMQFVDHIAKKEQSDSSRIYLTGLSMGGYGTWSTALRYPDYFAAILPICGGTGGGIVNAERLRTLPIWAFHGAADQVVPQQTTLQIANRIKRKNAKHQLKVTIYEGVTHDSWTQTYDNPEVWEWLLKQKKSF